MKAGPRSIDAVLSLVQRLRTFNEVSLLRKVIARLAWQPERAARRAGGMRHAFEQPQRSRTCTPLCGCCVGEGTRGSEGAAGARPVAGKPWPYRRGVGGPSMGPATQSSHRDWLVDAGAAAEADGSPTTSPSCRRCCVRRTCAPRMSPRSPAPSTRSWTISETMAEHGKRCRRCARPNARSSHTIARNSIVWSMPWSIRRHAAASRRFTRLPRMFRYSSSACIAPARP